MKYFSEITNKTYDSVKELEAAEKLVSDKATKRKEAAKVVEDSYQKYVAARKEWQKNLNDFCKEYGAYHTTVKPGENDPDLFDALIKLNALW